MPSPRFIPIPGAPAGQPNPDGRFRMLGATPAAPPPAAAAAPAAPGATAGPRFRPVPGQQAPGLRPPVQAGTGQGSAIPGAVGLGLGGLNTGVQGLNLINRFGDNFLGDLSGLQQGVGGLTGLFGLAQGIRNDNPLSAIGGGIQAADSLSGLAGGPTLSSLAGSAGGYIAPGIGAALGIAQNALAGNVEPEKQAFDASLAAVAAGLAPATAGISLLAPVLMAIGGPLVGEKPSVFDAKRSAAGRESLATLSGISGAIRGSAQKFAETGNLGDALQGLQTHFGGPRNPVKSALFLPPDVATQLGFSSNSIGWDEMSPQKFQQVLTRMAAEPDQGLSWVRGSGDIGYLSEFQARGIGAEVKAQTDDYLHFLMVAKGLVPNTPWESRYAPFVEMRRKLAEQDRLLAEERNDPRLQNPEGYQPPPEPYDAALDAFRSGSA